MKNILIFLPIVFGRMISDSSKLTACLLGFLAFSVGAGAVYTINDIFDASQDRKHPIKKNRPIAAGKVSVKEAVTLAVVLVCVSIGITLLIPVRNFAALCLIPLYIIINIIYSRVLKHRPIFDICILAMGYIMRVFYGSLITGIEISHWLYLTVLTMSFYLGFGKRRNELKAKGDDTRAVLGLYSHSFLDKNMYLFLGLTITFYSMWAVATPQTEFMIWTVPVVIIICMRYSLIIEGESTTYGDPIEVFLHDAPLVIMAVIYALIMLAILYLTPLF